MEFHLVHVELPEIIVMAVVGIILLFFGYGVKKIAFFVIWFLIGYSLMQYFLPTINGWLPDIAANQLWQILLPIGGGLLLALLGLTIEKICVAGIVFGLTMVITMKYFGNDLPTLGIGAVFGVILSAIAVTIMKPATIVATSLAGAYCLTVALLTWQTGIDPKVFYFPIIAGLTLLGTLCQFKTAKHL